MTTDRAVSVGFVKVVQVSEFTKGSGIDNERPIYSLYDPTRGSGSMMFIFISRIGIWMEDVIYKYKSKIGSTMVLSQI